MVRPVDLQDNFAKTTAVERIAQSEKSQPETAQKQHAATAADKNAQAQKKTVQAERTDEAILRRTRDQRQDGKKDRPQGDPEKTATAKQPEQTDDEQHDQDSKNDQERDHLDVQA